MERNVFGKLQSARLVAKEESMVCNAQALRSTAYGLTNTFGVIAVAILAIIRSKSNAFKPSTVIIEQYRPPIGATIIGQTGFNQCFETH
jgi:hypothetical protein